MEFEEYLKFGSDTI